MEIISEVTQIFRGGTGTQTQEVKLLTYPVRSLITSGSAKDSQHVLLLFQSFLSWLPVSPGKHVLTDRCTHMHRHLQPENSHSHPLCIQQGCSLLLWYQLWGIAVVPSPTPISLVWSFSVYPPSWQS